MSKEVFARNGSRGLPAEAGVEKAPAAAETMTGASQDGSTPETKARKTPDKELAAIKERFEKFEEMELEPTMDLTEKFQNPDLPFEERMNVLNELTKEWSIEINAVKYWQKDGKLYSELFSGEITKKKFAEVFKIKK